jgi:hypothetical protein
LYILKALSNIILILSFSSLSTCLIFMRINYLARSTLKRIALKDTPSKRFENAQVCSEEHHNCLRTYKYKFKLLKFYPS